MAGSTGIEPATSGLTVQCANQAAPRARLETSAGYTTLRRNATIPRTLEALEKLQHRRVDFVGAFLLRPVSAPGEDQGLAELGHELRQIGDELIHAAEGQHEVTVAGDVERGDAHHRARVGSEELPVAIDVAIPVEAAAKARAREFLHVVVDIGLGEPG